MSTLKLLLPGGKALTFGSPFKKETNKLAGLSLFINIVSLTVVSIFAFLLPVSGTLFNADSETSTLKFLILFVFIFLVILVLKLLVQGTSFIIDPKGMLMILVFNLILTTLSIMITTVRVSNTFGTTGFRYISGLALMSLIGLFYFLNLYVANKVGLKRILNFIAAGSLLYILLSIISNNQTSMQILANLPLITLGFSILLYRVLKSETKTLGTSAVIVVGLLIIISLPINSVTYSNLFYYSLLVLIASSLVIALYALKNKKILSYRITQIKSRIVNFIKVKKISTPNNKVLADLHLSILLVLPLILLTIVVVLFLNIPEASRTRLFTDLSTPYTDAIRIIMAGSDTVSGNNLRSIIMGVGSDNYNPVRPFFANILIISGLIGSVIYLWLWLYFVKSAKVLFIKYIKDKKDFKLMGLLLFSVILIPLVLLTTYSNLLTIILLWIMYSIISSKQSNINLNYLDNTITSAIDFKRISGALKTLAGVALLIGILYSANIIFTVLK